MDEIKFRIGEFVFGADSNPSEVVRIFINGESLREIVAKCESAAASADGRPSLAGDYSFLSLSDFSINFLDEIKGGKAVLMGCTCGFWDCWTLECDVVLREDRAEFLNFRNKYRPHWKHGLNFKFDAANFTSEVEKIKAAINEKFTD